MTCLYLYLTLFTTFFSIKYVPLTSALKCYECEEQESNWDECVKTTKPCGRQQDICTSHVQWKIPPYKTARGERMYFISKSCDNKQACLRRKQHLAAHCKRENWHTDWACVECCQGELCNYYVTLAAPSFHQAGNTSVLLLLLLICSSLLLHPLLPPVATQ